MDKKIHDILEHAKLDKKAAGLDNDLLDDIIGIMRARRSVSKPKAAQEQQALAESEMILETEERELLQR